jgi:NSS family neurotransmitter:Na+ symporter
MERSRDHWSSRLAFVLAAAGSAIGLGNLWKFPFITWDNRGGAFVLVYLICIAGVGLPIMMAEILMGRRTQRSAVGALKKAAGPAWGIVGGLGVLTGFVILGYYTVIAGWSLRNFASCLGWSLGGFPEDPAAVGAGFEAFLQNGSQQILLTALFMMSTMTVIYGGVTKGIERVARVLMPTLFGILILLLLRALTLGGAAEALSFIFVPDFSELSGKAVLEALGHSFFTLSLGMGAMITYGSYISRRESIVRSSLIVVVLDTVIALVATVVMFAVIFSVAGMAEQVSNSSVGMLFMTLPQLFYTEVPFGGLLAPLFYVLVAFAALTSTISLLEVVVSYFIDQWGVRRTVATSICGLGTFVLSLLCSLSLGAWSGVSGFVVFSNDAGPKEGLLQNLDHLASNWLLPVGGFFITLAVGWAMTRQATESELVDATTPRWFNFDVWRFFIRYVAPLAVAAIIVAVIAGRDFS